MRFILAVQDRHIDVELRPFEAADLGRAKWIARVDADDRGLNFEEGDGLDLYRDDGDRIVHVATWNGSIGMMREVR